MTGRVLGTAGVSVPEEAAYVELLQGGPATRGELAERMGLSRSRAAELLAGLELQGLAHRTPAPRGSFAPVPPPIAVEQLIERRQSELVQLREAASELTAVASSAPTRRRTDELVEIVQGRAGVECAFEQLQRTARREVCVLDAPPYASTEMLNTTEVSLLEAGITYRGVYAEEALEVDGMMRTLARHLEAGENARMTHVVPTKLALADRSLALLPLSWTSATQDAAVLVHPCGLLDALAALFENVWAAATPLRLDASDQSNHPGGLSSADRELVSLLVAGLTDEAIAARTGSSRRTIVRRVARLMNRAGARSRLQLGWRARELGWLAGADGVS